MQFTVEDVKLTSGWTIKVTQGSGSTPSSYYNSGANTVKTTRTFSFAALPKGSIINSASISCSRRGSNSGSLRTVDGKNDSVNSTANITIAASRITAGGTLEIEFVYRATAYSYSSSGYYNGSTWWEDIVLTVDYTGYTACTAPTTVSINNSTATPSQTRTLSWSGAQAGLNNAISKYEIYRATTASGTYSKLGETNAATRSLAVTAPSSAGSYFYKVKTIGAVSGYSSGLSSAYASVSVSITAPSVPTNLTLTPASQYPTGTSVLSWTSSPGTSNPITGYKVYKSTSANGTYSLLATVSTNSYSITVPQSGNTYYKVMTVGTYLDSGLSGYVTLTVDMSGTSTFTVSNTVDAGDTLTVEFTSNTDKAHTTVFSIGSYSNTVTTAANVTTASYTIPLNWLNAIPNSRTGSLTVKVTTSGAGTVTQATTLRAPASTAPTGVDGTVSPSSTTVPAAWGVYLESLSVAAITINTAATAQYGATVVRYMIDGPGVHFEGSALPLAATSGKLIKGNQTFTLSAVDSRGLIGTKQIIINVLAYEKPTLKNILSLRSDDQGEEEDEGTYVLAKATIQWTSIQGENTASCAVSYRKQGVSTWASAGTLTNGELLFGGSITAADNWEVRYIVTDTLGSSNTYYDIVTRAVWEFHVKRGGGAWAFGGIADQDGALKVYGEISAVLGNVPKAVCDINSDLNNATETGFYYYTLSDAHIPQANANGKLLVIKTSDNYVYQFALPNASLNDFKIWARSYVTGSWGAWVRISSAQSYPYIRNTVLDSTATISTANTWVNTGLTVNLTAGHLYAFEFNYASGLLLGIQLRRNNNAYTDYEYIAETGGMATNISPIFYCATSTTYQVWVKRAATGSNGYKIIDLGVTT